MPRFPSHAWRTLLAAVLAGGLAGCQSSQSVAPAPARPLEPVRQAGPQPPPTPLTAMRSGPLRIALLAPFSGDFGEAGREIANGAAIALFEAPENAAEIIAFDTNADAAKTREALEHAVGARADLVIGPLFGANAAAVAPDLEAANLIALTFSNDGSIAGPRIAVMGRAVQAEATRIIRQAAADGAHTIAVFGKADPVGLAAAAQAEREAAATTGLAVRPILYAADASYTDIARNVKRLIDAGGRDLARASNAERLEAQLNAAPDPAETLTRLAAGRVGPERDLLQDLAGLYGQMTQGGANRPSALNAVVARYRTAGGLGSGGVDAVLLTIGGAELSTVAPMFQLYDADTAGVRLLGLSNWSEMDPARARELHGGRFPAEPYSDAFDIKYEAAFGAAPSELAGVAYDAVKLALASSGAGAARPTPMAALAAAGDVQGARGLVRISTVGIALRPLEVLEMQATGLLPVDPARIVDPARPPLTAPPRPAGS